MFTPLSAKSVNFVYSYCHIRMILLPRCSNRNIPCVAIHHCPLPALPIGRRGKNGHDPTMRCRMASCGIAWNSMSLVKRVDYIQTNPPGSGLKSKDLLTRRFGVISAGGKAHSAHPLADDQIVKKRRLEELTNPSTYPDDAILAPPGRTITPAQ